MYTINNDTMCIMMSFMRVEEMETLKRVSSDLKKSIEHNKRKFNEMKLIEIYGEYIFDIFDYSEIKEYTDYEKNHIIMLEKMITHINENDIKYKIKIFMTIYDYMYKQYTRYGNSKNILIKIKNNFLNKEGLTKNQTLYFNGFRSITRYWGREGERY